MEWYVAITSLVVEASHLLRPGDWSEAYRQLHRCGRPGAFANGILCLATGALIVAGHGAWSWPGGVVTAYGWLLVAKGGPVPAAARQGPARDGAGQQARRLRRGGVVMLAVGAWACYCLWNGVPSV